MVRDTQQSNSAAGHICITWKNMEPWTRPNLPFFTGAKRGNVEVEISASSRRQVQSSATISPGKRVN